MSYETPPQPQDFASIKTIYVDLTDLNKSLEDCLKKTKISHQDFLETRRILIENTHNKLKAGRRDDDSSVAKTNINQFLLKTIKNKEDISDVIVNINESNK
jgi:hypothetical protein